MKKLLKLFTLATGILASCSVLASTHYYGQPKKNLTALNTSFVVLRNYVVDQYHWYDTFTANATFYSGNYATQSVSVPVGFYGSGTDVVTFQINSPDTQVCVDIYRNYDNAHVNYTCASSGNINIGPYAMKSHLPIVKFTQN